MQITGTGTDPTSAELMLVNPHGDIAATIPNTTNVAAAQVSGVNDTDEYGIVETPPGPTPYGWEGAAQRSTADQAGIIQMGARQYNPTSGRFLTLDPIPGGNPNPYTYPVDPVNSEDLAGEFQVKRCRNRRASCGRFVFGKGEVQAAVNGGTAGLFAALGLACGPGSLICVAVFGIVGIEVGKAAGRVIHSARIVNVAVFRSRGGLYRTESHARWRGLPPGRKTRPFGGGGGSW